MQPIPLVRIWSLLPFLRFLDGIGAPVGRWLEQSRIPCEFLDSPERCIPLEFALDFAERAAREEGAETIGIDVGRQMTAEELGGWTTLLDCVTLLDRIQTSCREVSIENTGVRMWLEVQGESASLCHGVVDGLGPGVRHLEDFALMLILEGLGRAADEDWKPDLIRIPSQRSERFRRDELFQGVRIEYGSPHLEVVFPRAMLSRPLRPWQPSENASIDGTMRQGLPPRDLVGSLEEVVATIVHLGPPSIDEVARLTNSSVRTLQRHLADEGVSLSTIVDHARFQLADLYLRDSTATITDVAYQLGYSNPPAFTRAFRRWTGIAPHTYQLQLTKG